LIKQGLVATMPLANVTIVNVAQRSPEWCAARLGRLTGSRADVIFALGKGGAESVQRAGYRLDLVLERLTGRSMEKTVVTDAMEAGIEREPEARRAFEALTGEVVSEAGFLRHDELMLGASLDGYLGDFEELVSIKCRQPRAHLEFYKTRTLPRDAESQIRHELLLTPAQRHHYFSFNPDFPPSMRSVLVTLERATLDVPGYEREAMKFLGEVATEEESLRTMDSFSGQAQRVLAGRS